jgi:microcystin-dependent protein
MDFYLATIFLFGGNFNFRGTQMCNGQILSISQNAALFSLIGTYYGGNGTSNFQLPDLRGRTPISQGQGPGLSPYDIGEQVGTTTTTLLSSNIPLHTHLVNVVNGAATATSVNPPTNAFFGEGPKAGLKSTEYYTTATPNTPLSPLSIGTNVGGGSNPVSIMQPYLALTYLIATVGVFPSRN